MEPSRAKHVSEEDLERYSMNQLAEPELAEVEMHLLVCAECQDRVTESDRFVRAMRDAASRLRREPARHLWPAWWRPALAVAFAVVLLIVAGVRLGSRNAAPALAVLQASRGPMPAHSQVPAGKPLQLEMDLTDLASFPAYGVEVVDQSGHRFWQGPAAIKNGHAVVSIPKPLAKGRYYVRLYSPSSELLREYGLEAI
jgi:methionine-rich copper-binding protein CopC